VITYATQVFGTINGTDYGGGMALVPSYMASFLQLVVQ
jgi:hypothetical protein